MKIKKYGKKVDWLKGLVQQIMDINYTNSASLFNAGNYSSKVLGFLLNSKKFGESGISYFNNDRIIVRFPDLSEKVLLELEDRDDHYEILKNHTDSDFLVKMDHFALVAYHRDVMGSGRYGSRKNIFYRDLFSKQTAFFLDKYVVLIDKKRNIANELRLLKMHKELDCFKGKAIDEYVQLYASKIN